MINGEAYGDSDITKHITLCFRCFKGKDNSDAFNESLILEGINYVIYSIILLNLFFLLINVFKVNIKMHKKYSKKNVHFYIVFFVHSYIIINMVTYY